MQQTENNQRNETVEKLRDAQSRLEFQLAQGQEEKKGAASRVATLEAEVQQLWLSRSEYEKNWSNKMGEFQETVLEQVRKTQSEGLLQREQTHLLAAELQQQGEHQIQIDKRLSEGAESAVRHQGRFQDRLDTLTATHSQAMDATQATLRGNAAELRAGMSDLSGRVEEITRQVLEGKKTSTMQLESLRTSMTSEIDMVKKAQTEMTQANGQMWEEFNGLRKGVERQVKELSAQLAEAEQFARESASKLSLRLNALEQGSDQQGQALHDVGAVIKDLRTRLADVKAMAEEEIRALEGHLGVNDTALEKTRLSVTNALGSWERNLEDRFASMDKTRDLLQSELSRIEETLRAMGVEIENVSVLSHQQSATGQEVAGLKQDATHLRDMISSVQDSLEREKAGRQRENRAKEKTLQDLETSLEMERSRVNYLATNVIQHTETPAVAMTPSSSSSSSSRKHVHFGPSESLDQARNYVSELRAARRSSETPAGTFIPRAFPFLNIGSDL